LLEPLDLFEQAPHAVGPAWVDAEALEKADSGGGCAVCSALLHSLSVRRWFAAGIGSPPDLRCG
jgi:hypothetical protein